MPAQRCKTDDNEFYTITNIPLLSTNNKEWRDGERRSDPVRLSLPGTCCTVEPSSSVVRTVVVISRYEKALDLILLTKIIIRNTLEHKDLWGCFV